MKRLIVLLLPVVFLGIFASFEQEAEVTEPSGYRLYFLSSSGENGGGDAVREYYVEGLEGETTEETASHIVQQLIDGVPGLKSPLPAGTQLRGLTVEGRRAKVDFTAGYGTLSGIDLTLADYCITLSLTGLDEIGGVSITTNGRPLPYKDTEILLENDVLLSTAEDVIDTMVVSLFFLDEEGNLVPEQRTIALYEGDVLAEVLLRTLLEGPAEKGHTAVIPTEFTINSVRIENRTCYISLPSSSMAALPRDETSQRRILESIAQTVYALDGVEELCFLVDGQESNLFGKIPVIPYAIRTGEEP